MFGQIGIGGTTQEFRREHFSHLKDVLGPCLKKEGYSDAPGCACWQMTLWYLGTQVDFRSLGALFGVGKSTVCDIVHETCRIMRQVLTKNLRKIS